MRNGDLYKIQSMDKAGRDPADIFHLFRNKYSVDEIQKFLTKKAEPVLSESDKPTPKRKARKRSTAKG